MAVMVNISNDCILKTLHVHLSIKNILTGCIPNTNNHNQTKFLRQLITVDEKFQSRLTENSLTSEETLKKRDHCEDWI